MKGLLLLTIVLSVVVASRSARWYELEESNYDFDRFIKDFQKPYVKGTAEYAERETIFFARLKDIIKHNREPHHTWKKGVNHMSDLSDAEFSQLLGLKKRTDRSSSPHHIPHPASLTVSSFSEAEKAQILQVLPPSMDWRLRGAVTPVKDQGFCGSCWTFAAAATVESAVFLKTGLLQELSEQQIASCSPNPHDCGGTGGCEGGTAEIGFAGVIAAGGLASEWNYPYVSHGGQDFPCKFNKTQPAPSAKLVGFTKLPNNTYEDLLLAVATISPIAISVDASSWSSYEEGVFAGCDMSAPVINHAVQLVGYGTAKEGDFWLVRNSWTPTWGEQGYIRIQRSSNPPCGVDTSPSEGSGCTPGPQNVTVCGMCGILSDSAYAIAA